jgi:hypothetical protein
MNLFHSTIQPYAYLEIINVPFRHYFTQAEELARF